MSTIFFILQVNGVRVALPHSPSPLMSLTLAGQYITLQTTFGLRVRWDGNHYAQISVPRWVQKLFLIVVIRLLQMGRILMFFRALHLSCLVFLPAAPTTTRCAVSAVTTITTPTMTSPSRTEP